MLTDVFGEAAVIKSLDARVERLSRCREISPDAAARASELHQLTTWMAAAAETIELESEAAADLQVYLATILDECEAFVSAVQQG